MKAFKELTVSDFPGVDPEKFEKWKQASIRANRNTLIFLPIVLAIATLNVTRVINVGAIGDILLIVIILAGIVGIRREPRALEKELGLTSEIIGRARRGESAVQAEEPTEQPQGEPLSFMDKAAGVFYEPSRVFGAFKTSPVKVADWLVPLALLAIVIGLQTYVKFSSPDLRFQIAQQQEQRSDKMVAEGKISADQAAQAKERMESGSSTFMVIGVFSAIVVVFIIFFLAAAVWLIIGKFIIKGNVNYSQMMGVAGLSSWISIVGGILSIVLMVLLSRLDAGLHLGMLTQMDANSKVYSIMRTADLFGIWNIAATSIGIGTIAGKKGLMITVWVFGIWIVLVLITIFALGGLFGG